MPTTTKHPSWNSPSRRNTNGPVTGEAPGNRSFSAPLSDGKMPVRQNIVGLDAEQLTAQLVRMRKVERELAFIQYQKGRVYDDVRCLGIDTKTFRLVHQRSQRNESHLPPPTKLCGVYEEAVREVERQLRENKRC